MTSRFERDTAVRLVAEPAPGVRTFEARMDRGWWVVEGPNGGYVAAVVLRALAASAEPDRPARSLTVHYTARPQEGAVQVETRVERSGRSLTSLSARLVQDGRLLALALAAFSKPREAPSFQHAPMPEVAPPEACEPNEQRIPIHQRFDSRRAIGAPAGAGAAQALTGGWIRPVEPAPVDAPLVAALTDAWPPACFSWAKGHDQLGPVPTVDLTIHFRQTLPRTAARPDDYQLVVFRSRLAREGFIEEDGEVWSRDGTLLAQSRQLALLV